MPDSVPERLRLLYAIQGTGNGHLARARELVPLLNRFGDVDVLVSGQHAEVALPYPVKYRCKGLGFIFGKSGGVDLLATFAKNNTRRLLKEIASLPVEKYDLILSDFEPVSAWAARSKGLPCVQLSHQAAVLAPEAPHPDSGDFWGRIILQQYAPGTASYGFHFKRYNAQIFTPVIRSEVRSLTPTYEGYYTVYLPAYDDERIIKVLGKLDFVRWHVFSKHTKKAYKEGNIRIQPIQNDAFLASMAAAEGVLCGAGFETPAEALFLGKKVMAIPMKNQYEQQCNAAALADLGIPILKNLKKKRLDKIEDWVTNTAPPPAVDYPDISAQILEAVVARHGHGKFLTSAPLLLA